MHTNGNLSTVEGQKLDLFITDKNFTHLLDTVGF